MHGLSLLADSGGWGGGSFLVAAHGLFIAMASLVAEHRLWAQGLQ